MCAVNQGNKKDLMSVWTQTPQKYVDGVELKGKVDDLAKEDAMLTGRKDYFMSLLQFVGQSFTFIYCIKASAAILILMAPVSGTVR